MFEAPGTTEGKFIEKDLLDETTYEIQKQLNLLKEKHKIPVGEALEIAKEMQPWENPHSPQKPFALDLYNTVATKIEEEVDKNFEWENLEYYTTVSFPSLDYNAGVDAFLELTR